VVPVVVDLEVAQELLDVVEVLHLDAAWRRLIAMWCEERSACWHGEEDRA